MSPATTNDSKSSGRTSDGDDDEWPAISSAASVAGICAQLRSQAAAAFDAATKAAAATVAAGELVGGCSPHVVRRAAQTGAQVYLP